MDYDVKLTGIYIDDEEIDAFPEADSGVSFDRVECSDDAEAVFDEDDWTLTIDDLTSESSCEIFFTRLTDSEIISNNTSNNTSNIVSKTSKGSQVENPDTGDFVSALLPICIIAILIIIIKKLRFKNKFFKI